jgi:hypothetical protein
MVLNRVSSCGVVKIAFLETQMPNETMTAEYNRSVVATSDKRSYDNNTTIARLKISVP